MKRSGKIMGRRTVAGQVIKESYGTAKQQHTFTVSTSMTSNVDHHCVICLIHSILLPGLF